MGLADLPAPGFRLDEASAVIGRGEVAFGRARLALASWAHFNLGWIEVMPAAAPIVVGADIAVVVRHLGFWSVNGCRIVKIIDRGAPVPASGFAYGTLQTHAEAGEEIFLVSFSPSTGDVTYSIRAASRVRAPIARLGYPVTRLLQARFRRDSLRAMAEAVRDRRV